MENKFSIPKPCHENWNEMLQEQQGRRCLACSKTVVDFTNWEADNILMYLQQKSSEKVCGRFNQEQVIETPDNDEILIKKVMHSRLPLLRKIAAVIVICFGLLHGRDTFAQQVKGKVACVKPERAEQLQGEIAMQSDTTKTQKPPKADTLKPQPQIMGMIAPYQPKKTAVIKQKTVKQKKNR